MLHRFGVATGGRLGLELGDHVGPHRLRTGALLTDGLDAIAKHRAGIIVNTVFDDSLVVVDEQARRSEYLREALLHLVELDRAADGVGGAAAELALVVNGRAVVTKIDFG